ncbi:hypothetical protein [Candidatus Planktophila dulcis]|uniref:hypothetical protein n=1 Tax=Candidatus Planktophila dulcis TaxID=1884914 RepID=UPI003CFA473B
MNVRALKALKASVAGLVVLESLLLAFFMRPIQDDYFNLQSVGQMGVVGYLRDTWDFHGGNMVQFLIHCMMILPSTEHFAFWNFGLFFLLTEVFVFLSVRGLNKWLFQSQNEVTNFWVPLLSVAGFEGLFVPGFLGAFGFSLASLAHLWPVMAFVTGLLSLKRFRGSCLLALTLGMIAGNSNLGESAFACGVWILGWLAYWLFKDFETKSGIRKDSNFYFLGLGTLVGSIGIAAAPGFWDRAQDQVGLPNSLFDFAKRFAKSFASFTADALTHPMAWVLFLLGALLAHKYSRIAIEVDRYRLKLLSVATIAIWLSLITGATFAYPAWHQSMGMYVLLLPLSFAAGATVKLRLSTQKLYSLLVVAAIVMSLAFVRIGVLGVERSLRWDRNLATNSCRIEQDLSSKLLGAEIQYPPFGLGVDDVNTWEWMRSKYVGWVEAIPEKKCES